MKPWRAKIDRFGARRLRASIPCGTCQAPINKGDELFTTLWMRGAEGCTTRRHADCDEGQPPTEAEIAEHKRRREMP